MPFGALKENRVVDGIPMSGTTLAGAGLFILALATGAAVVIVAVLPGVGRTSRRLGRLVYVAAGLISFWLTAALLARASLLLGEQGASPRVSPGLGFWGLPLASYVLINHAKPPPGRGRMIALILALLLPAGLILSGGRGEAVSVVREFSIRRGRFMDETLVHLRLFGVAVSLAALIGVPMGILSANNTKLAGPLVAFVDGVQTIPSMALFGLLMAPLAAISRAVPVLRAIGIRGIGGAPALIALTLYAMLPVVRNTIAGLAAVPEAALEAGRGMGMSSWQLFHRVRWPMALPYLLAGLRTASVQAVGNAAVAALIGAGGLGIMIFQGLGQAAPDLILLGVIPLIALAVGVDRLWDGLIRIWVSPGLGDMGAAA